jgi:hypothetical protein
MKWYEREVRSSLRGWAGAYLGFLLMTTLLYYFNHYFHTRRELYWPMVAATTVGFLVGGGVMFLLGHLLRCRRSSRTE